ncbi:YciI family protein [Sediminibacterium soli]|uniref:YciI family protein n=1 Tax=Sediminibacterium soli TaxID=2698829 RepID=UPI00137B6DA1|nr:YciI family protein [Sediminibacterium soli]NCI47109.1 hypothetical protein [Sediminibacterium soli]
MRTSCLVFFLFVTGFSAGAQTANPVYNKPLADSLGADEYGMKMYVLVILKTGPAQITEKKTSDSLFAGHMANIGRLAKEGKLTVAGPLQKNERNYRGIFIFNVHSIEEAKTIVQTDPAVKAGIFDTELYGWYGSAALPMYLPYTEKVSRQSF